MEIVSVTKNNSQQLRLRSLDHPSPITVGLGYSKVTDLGGPLYYIRITNLQ